MYTSYKQSLAMADQFHTGIFGESWWNSSKSTFVSSPCSSSINDIGSFGWPSEVMNMKARSCDESMMLQTMQKPHEQPDSDSTWQVISTTNCNETSLGRTESNYHYPMLQGDMSTRLNYKQAEIDYPRIQKEWSPSNLGEDSSMNQLGFSSDEPCLDSVMTSSSNCTRACQGISTTNFNSMSSASYDCSTSNLVQTLFDIDLEPQQSQYDKPLVNNPSIPNYSRNSNDFSPPLPKFSPLLNPSLPKLEPTNNFLFNNNTTFYNSESLLSMFKEKPNSPNIAAKSGKEGVQFSSSVLKTSSCEPALKRPRFDAPSPLPTFKFRKEKLGDRITALQQLVSPFGKTDTASVLHEAILYIKFLYDQLHVLSTPYLENGHPIQHQQTCDNLKNDSKGHKQELRSRGLCLVPISSTFPVVNETTADFWNSTF